jgi:integrase/recombinase XerD
MGSALVSAACVSCLRDSRSPEARLGPGEVVPGQERRAQDIVKAVADRAGIRNEVSPHVLRHTFATMALQKGISLPAVQMILDHDRLQTTAIYLNFTDTHIQEEFERKWLPL